MPDWNQYITTLKQIVCSRCCESIASGQTQLIIKETDRMATLKKVTITNINNEFAAFTPEKASQVSAMLSSCGDYQKAADCLVFLRHNEKNYILVCELKSGTTKRLVGQLRNTAAIADFITSLCKHHHDLSFDQWNMRFIVLKSKGSLKKRPTRPSQSPPAGSCIARPLEISVQNNASIPIAQLCR